MYVDKQSGQQRDKDETMSRKTNKDERANWTAMMRTLYLPTRVRSNDESEVTTNLIVTIPPPRKKFAREANKTRRIQTNKDKQRQDIHNQRELGVTRNI